MQGIACKKRSPLKARCWRYERGNASKGRGGVHLRGNKSLGGLLKKKEKVWSSSTRGFSDEKSSWETDIAYPEGKLVNDSKDSSPEKRGEDQSPKSNHNNGGGNLQEGVGTDLPGKDWPFLNRCSRKKEGEMK